MKGRRAGELVRMLWGSAWGRLQGFYLAVGALVFAGLAVAVLALWGLSGLTEEVLEGETLGFDSRIMLWIDGFGTPALDRFAIEATELGGSTVVIAIGIVAVTLLWLLGRPRFAALIVVGLAGGVVFNPVLKTLFGRPRPQLFEWRIDYAGLASYPSGHTTMGTILYIVLAYVIHRLAGGRRWLSVTAAFVAASLCLVIGFTRIYLGVHYPTDVLAGYAVGFIWAVFSTLVVESVGRRHALNAGAAAGRGPQPRDRPNRHTNQGTRNMHLRSISVLAALVGLAGCDESQSEVGMASQFAARPAAVSAPNAAAGVRMAPRCELDGAVATLPDAVRETSGLAQSRRDPGIFWTHNDAGNDPEIFAIGSDGAIVQRVRVLGAELDDWEAIETGPCGSGDCLFIGDIGDNEGAREVITLYQIPEPAAGATESAPATALNARFPDSPQDAEALFVLPDGDAYVVTKGRAGPIRVYRFPVAEAASGEVAQLQLISQLFAEPENEDNRLTGAGASPDGQWVGLRTYRSLHLYPATELTSGTTASAATIDLAPLGEAQGESLTIGADGVVWLTSEAENRDDSPQLSRLRCTFDPL